ncbi:MAG: hypothetical protein KDD77_18455 [Caldilineaceae bacterium]|nr:hypothetical protein [Caldilineaceae bacterium]
MSPCASHVKNPRQRRWTQLPLVVVLSACAAGQGESSSVESATRGDDKDRGVTVAKGEIVTELDKAIWHVFQAKNGDYWFGSHDRGVYRYSGDTLVNFTTKDGLCDDSLGLGGIQEDGSGNVYFNTAKGISRFDGRTFVTLRAAKGHSATGEWKLQPDDLWFQGAQDAGALYRYDGETLHHLEFPKTRDGDEHYRRTPRDEFPNAKYSPYDVYRIFKDRGGNVWFGTAALGVCRFDGTSFAWLPESELRNGSFGARSIVEDREGRFWFCSTQHGYEVDLTESTGPKFKRVGGSRGASNSIDGPIKGIMSSLVDDAGSLWMATYGSGVFRCDGSGVTRHAVKDDGRDITLFSIYEDNQGVLWLGTQGAGAYRFNGETFVKFRP